jgi:glycosyltransferase involved in cell wall biosynthesis
MKPPRILQVIHGDEAGGVKTLADALGETLRADGHVVDTVCLFPPHPAGVVGKLAGMARVGRLILTGRYDAVMAYQSTASVVAGVAGWLARCPRRIVHQTVLPSELKPALRWLDLIVGTSGLYTVNVLNSKATWAAFARYPALYRSRMRLIEHGVLQPVPKRDRAATLARFAVPDDRRILLNVGRLAVQKNQGVLIRALAEISSVRLVVAGDGPLRGALEADAAEWGVADRLHLLGDVGRQDVADLLAASDVFVFPSIWESFGLAAVEAALLGRRIVASDLDVLREVLAGHDVAASFVPPNDATAWTAAIRVALTPPVGGLAARNGLAISERYTVRRMADAYGWLLAGAPSAQAARSS